MMGWWIAVYALALATFVFACMWRHELGERRSWDATCRDIASDRNSLREQLTRTEAERDQLLAKIEKAKGDLS